MKDFTSCFWCFFSLSLKWVTVSCCCFLPWTLTERFFHVSKAFFCCSCALFTLSSLHHFNFYFLSSLFEILSRLDAIWTTSHIEILVALPLVLLINFAIKILIRLLSLRELRWKKKNFALFALQCNLCTRNDLTLDFFQYFSCAFSRSLVRKCILLHDDIFVMLLAIPLGDK